eukprot:05416.XXX_143387_144555_1 [CDS] Oithona nana genome sequencing.
MPLCCQIRTGVLFLGFFLGFSEVTSWVFYYTWRPEIRAALVLGPEDPDFELTVLSVVVIVDLVVNILLISGANKDYSGRRKDLRRWGFMVPWVIIYGLNILGLFTSSIVIFYSLEGGMKALGIFPLMLGCCLLIGHFAVLYFVLDQRSDWMSGACNNIVSEASSPA